MCRHMTTCKSTDWSSHRMPTLPGQASLQPTTRPKSPLLMVQSCSVEGFLPSSFELDSLAKTGSQELLCPSQPQSPSFVQSSHCNLRVLEFSKVCRDGDEFYISSLASSSESRLRLKQGLRIAFGPACECLSEPRGGGAGRPINAITHFTGSNNHLFCADQPSLQH